MNKLNFLIFAFVILTITSFGQGKEKDYDNYTEIEKRTEECIDNWLETKNVAWAELKTSFENYFSSSKITNSNDQIEKQYLDILTFIEKPARQFPILKDKQKILAIKDNLGLSDKDILSKNQLDCFTNQYIENKTDIDTTSSFYVFGSSFETMKQIPDISPGLLAGAVKMAMDKKDLKKELYQKTIVLMYYFDFALFLK